MADRTTPLARRSAPPAAGRSASAHHGAGSADHAPRKSRPLTRIFLAILTTLLAVNLWTGGPLLAVWVGSRVQAAQGNLTMGAIGATVGVLVVTTIVLYKALMFLSRRYDALVGRDVGRPQAAWLKPMSGQRRSLDRSKPLTAVEKVIIVMVVVAFEALVVWFFFFAHYKLPG